MKRALSAMLMLVLSGPLWAVPSYDDKVEPYVVKSGDTISAITRQFLGDSLFWEDNWRLNPQVRDPDKLRIGQVLQIIVERKVIAQSAEVTQAVNRTEKMLASPRWMPASQGDELASGQGLRTRENSTAELQFNVESRLRLAEFSQLFLASKETSLRGVDRGSVTVEQGAVDLVFEPLDKSKTQIELTVGPSVTRPVASAGQPTELRTGTADDGGARVMVFAGASKVAAGGAQVSVPGGMGTRVPESGPPAPPEPLLPAPRLPQSAQSWNYNNGLLVWEPVDKADRYTVEICADAQCQRPLQRAVVAGDTPRFQVAPLPQGSAHWRVFAVSASDLDGYVSTTASVEVSEAVPDLEGPMLAVIPLSGFIEADDGSYRIGPKAEFSFLAHDERSGEAHIELLSGQGEWQPWPPTRSWSVDGQLDRVVRIRAYDRLGNRTELALTLVSSAGAGDAAR